jgi:hypothetical protein
MVLSIPPYLHGADVVTSLVRYRWDEWNVNAYFLEIDPAQKARLNPLSDAANLALVVGSAEWIVHSLSSVSRDPDPSLYLEAAWAAIVHPGYCEYLETDADEWRGPIRGPLNVTMAIVNDGIHCRETDPLESTRACWMYNLARHVLPRADVFDKWFESCVLRFEQFHPRIEDDDIWEEGPPFGLPVPREAVDPDFPYDALLAPELLDRFLRSLQPGANRFLASPEDVSQARNFSGVPYVYSPQVDSA